MKAARLFLFRLFGTETAQKLIGDQRRRTVLPAAAAFVLNLCYALYHGVLGAVNLSLWFAAMCAFYGILAVTRLFAVLCGGRRDPGTCADAEYFVLKLSGILLAALSFVLIAVVAVSLTQNIAVKHDEIVMIIIAAYTFAKITRTVVKAAGQRKNTSPLTAALCGISCAEAAASVLTLQRSMLVSFGAMNARERDLMDLLTGAAVCLFILILGALMTSKGIKKGITKDGKIKTRTGK
ncbi:hypothetical protein H8S23_04850 [Anaerofilum sp. BX8]|uniref:Uncharacterized protein n=1 Tax=Anaerofilum hominis TaxID=2763016 RepID=A0A923I8L7_9FIRM|nr:hypothetical protein [Anaerofilum hominis]